MNLAKTINTPCASYTKQAEYWPPVRALLGGTPAMRKAGKTYLPQEPAESDAAYLNRLNRSVLYNAFGKAVGSITGKILSKGVKLDDKTPEPIKTTCEYVDESGRDLERFMHDVVEDAMAIGRSHVFVDFPERPEEVVTVADEKAAGLRPLWVHIKAEQLIWWKLKAGKLVEIRIRECDGDNDTPQVRRLTATEWEIWQEGTETINKEWQIVRSGPNTLGEIALATFYTRRVHEMCTRPPLEDLAFKNIEHWQSSSDQRHILHVARVPILFGSGFDDDGDTVIGPNQLVKGPQGSTLAYIEHTGKSIEAGANDLKAIEEQMAVLAMEPILQSKSGTQTATARAMDGADAQAAIKLITGDIEDACDLCLAFTGKWLGMGKDQCGGVEIECDFSTQNLDAAGLVELGKARALGDISRSAYLAEFQRRNILSEEYDIEADGELAKSEMPDIAPLPTPPQGGDNNASVTT